LVLFILSILLFVVSIIAFAVWRHYRKSEEYDADMNATIGVWVASVALVVAIVLQVFAWFNTVDARSYGIQTSLGRYQNTLNPGPNWVTPWSSIEQWSTRNQTIRFAGDGRGEERPNYFTEPFVTVRLGNQSEAYVDVTITWKITKESVEGLWRQHKTFQDTRQDFATPTAQGAVNSAFDGYNPFSALNEKNAENPYVPLAEWSRRITEILRPLYASRGIDLVNVQATKVSYDKRTEDKLREFADAVANTRIKAQDVLTAQNEAAASAARKAQSGADCISLIRDLAAQDKLKDLPPGTNVCGGTSTPVIVGK
jgi:regulator of protease activity HflC (stomatin/prohibitin superfamily)